MDKIILNTTLTKKIIVIIICSQHNKIIQNIPIYLTHISLNFKKKQKTDTLDKQSIIQQQSKLIKVCLLENKYAK